MIITIYGRIPSKKNSTWTAIIRGRLIRLPSQKYKEWHKDASLQLRGTRTFKDKHIRGLRITFYAPDRRATDLTNKAESIMDLLVDNGVLEDDNWFVVPNIELVFGGVDKEKPRAEILIYENT